MPRARPIQPRTVAAPPAGARAELPVGPLLCIIKGTALNIIQRQLGHRRPRRHVDLPSGNRPGGDHHRRARAPGADEVRQRQAAGGLPRESATDGQRDACRTLRDGRAVREDDPRASGSRQLNDLRCEHGRSLPPTGALRHAATWTLWVGLALVLVNTRTGRVGFSRTKAAAVRGARYRAWRANGRPGMDPLEAGTRRPGACTAPCPATEPLKGANSRVALHAASR
jgi:hypothetical protein